jgi:hypothetical protein
MASKSIKEPHTKKERKIQRASSVVACKQPICLLLFPFSVAAKIKQQKKNKKIKKLLLERTLAAVLVKSRVVVGREKSPSIGG